MLRIPMFALLLALSATAFTGDVIRSVTLEVQGMNCAACPITVKKALKNVPGVSEVKVDYKSGIAEVDYDPNKTGPDDLAKAVAAAGYPATAREVR